MRGEGESLLQAPGTDRAPLEVQVSIGRRLSCQRIDCKTILVPFTFLVSTIFIHRYCFHMAIQCKASIDSAAHTSLSVDIASDPGQLAGPAVTVIIYGCRRASHPGRASQQGHKILHVPQDVLLKKKYSVSFYCHSQTSSASLQYAF